MFHLGNPVLQLACGRLLKSEDYADLIIFCGKKTFSLHRCRFLPQSGFLEALYLSSIEVHVPHFLLRTLPTTNMNSQNGESKIKLKDVDPDIFSLVVSYFYNGDYRTDPALPREKPVKTNKRHSDGKRIATPGGEPPSNMMIHFKVQDLAARFACEAPLSDLALKCFRKLAFKNQHTTEFLEAARFAHAPIPDKRFLEAVIDALDSIAFVMLSK